MSNPSAECLLLSSAAIELVLDQMAQAIVERLKQQEIQACMLIGIQRGGVWIANALQSRLDTWQLHQQQAKSINWLPVSQLNVSFYRDDFNALGLPPKVAPSVLHTNIDQLDVILVDDVLMSGRTVRAALNELFDYGRPASVSLAVLVDLPARQLPIQADIVGQHLSLPRQQRVKLRGPLPLLLERIQNN